MEINFESTKELFERLKPALKSKQTELKNNGYNYIHVIDIWDYLTKTKWQKSHNLSLYEMVSDILNSDNEFIDDYVKNVIRNTERKEVH